MSNANDDHFSIALVITGLKAVHLLRVYSITFDIKPQNHKASFNI